ncbi:AlwI family type II restriction endonuclease [Aerococcaceae bacterium zg-ZUI334]|uniref:AlwI family type II restriction endonuclease n=1 Tax=Aerococcaceae bacterium zg-252 TaxID=2796928 RepID=UPI001B9CC37B|nr:AlwI family type II restriction endonuclease [Aerococcaceae bacterium zg-ZUI334]
MVRTRRLERKPLSFSTTMRNPMRIVDFIKVVLPFEGKILDNVVISCIIKAVLKKKLYYTMPQKRKYSDILNSSELEFTDQQIEDVIEISPQNHKEAGFDKGWPSRFDTWYKLPMEFGFIYYKIGEKIEISEAGHLLVQTLELGSEQAAAQQQKIFLNALAKYQTDNPFRRNLIKNAPFILFLQTVKVLEDRYDWDKSGIYRSEIPFVTCWPDSDANKLADFINNFRTQHGKHPSDEIVYEACLKLLESGNEKRFKISQIVKEGVDDFIRKFRITGLISIRGMGRLVDINKFESDRVNYLIENYVDYPVFEDTYTYYLYAGTIDNNILEIISNEGEFDVSDIRTKTLNQWATELSSDNIDDELKVLATRNASSKHEVLKYIEAPTRFEFLTSIALLQQFPKLEVNPNYAIDDEGMPTFTARGGMGDIEVFGPEDDILVEVTLMQNKSQAVNEIPSITRHLSEFGDHANKLVYSLFIAPTLHDDTKYMIKFTKFHEKLEINGYTIVDFLEALRKSKKISDLRLAEQ